MSERTCPTVHVRGFADPGAILVHHGDPRRGWRSLVLRGPTLRIGAAPTADLVLDGIAPHHCTLHRRGARFVLHDHGSRLGTYVDSLRRREPLWIDDATRLGIGRHTLIIVPLPPPLLRTDGPTRPTAHDPSHVALSPFVADPRAHRSPLTSKNPSPLRSQNPSPLTSPRVNAPVGTPSRVPARDPRHLSIAPTPPSPEVGASRPTRATAPRPPRLLAALLAGAAGGALLGHQLTAALAAPTAPPSPPTARADAVTAPLDDSAPSQDTTHALAAPPQTSTLSAQATPPRAPHTPHTTPAPERAAPRGGARVGVAAPPTHAASPNAARTPATPAPTRVLRAAAGDTWGHLAHRHALPLAELRAANPTLRRELRGGDRLRLPLPRPLVEPPRACAAPLAAPAGALAVGSVDDGHLEGAVRLPDLPLYTLRCPAHAHATSATATALVTAIACFRERAGHRGEVVVGDLSREQGGPLGHHLSHQTGRDVDLWLPTLRHDYLRGCHHCGTDLCRPEPTDVDWLAAWQLIDALEATGQVTDVFLDRALHRDLADAALAAGVPRARVASRLGWAREGRPLVRHADAHRHHLHVRFRCGAGELTCEPHPRRTRSPRRPPAI